MKRNIYGRIMYGNLFFTAALFLLFAVLAACVSASEFFGADADCVKQGAPNKDGLNLLNGCPPLAGVQGVDETDGFAALRTSCASEEKIIQRRPYVYQEIDGKRVEVGGRFRVLSSGYGVKKLATRNPKHETQNPKFAMGDPESTGSHQNLKSQIHIRFSGRLIR